MNHISTPNPLGAEVTDMLKKLEKDIQDVLRIPKELMPTQPEKASQARESERLFNKYYEYRIKQFLIRKICVLLKGINQ